MSLNIVLGQLSLSIEKFDFLNHLFGPFLRNIFDTFWDKCVNLGLYINKISILIMINDILNKQPYDNLRGLDSTSMAWKRTHKAKQKIILIAISPDEFFSLVVNRTLMLKRRLSPCYCGALCYQGPNNSDSNRGFPILAHKYMEGSQNTVGVNVDRTFRTAKISTANIICF